jgi:hydrogenase-4 component B
LSAGLLDWALLLAVLWPFATASLLAIRATRPLALALFPWSGAPALAVALLLPDRILALPAAFLGSGLALDPTSRIFLAATAVLWLCAGWLMVGRQGARIGRWRSALSALIAMGAGCGLALAQDALLWFAAGTLAGYAFYGLLLQGTTRPARAAARRLVVLLVLGDLLLFELFLILAHEAGGTSFVGLREALATTENPVFVLFLMTLGLGIKAGVLGVHFWLLPSLRAGTPAVRLALIGFVSAAGLLGWLRLLPLGEIDWPGPGMLLHWLALATAAYALIPGLLKPGRGAVPTGILMALTAQWLWALAAALQRPEIGAAIATLLPVVALQSALGLSALMLLGDLDKTRGGSLRPALAWLAAAVVSLAPVPIFEVWAQEGLVAAASLWWPSIAVALLLGRFIAGTEPAETAAPDAPTEAPRHLGRRMVLAACLVIAALAVTLTGLLGYSPTAVWSPIQAAPVAWSTRLLLWTGTLGAAVLAGWAASRYFRFLPAPDAAPSAVAAWGSADDRLQALLGRIHHLARIRLPSWRDAILDGLAALMSASSRQALAQQGEARLMRWELALVMLVLLGLGMVWLGIGR